MPVIKSAKKAMRQAAVRRARNFPVRSELKSLIKKEMLLVKEGKVEDAKKLLPKVYSIIDKACKKNIIHRNNASRKKASMAKALAGLEKSGKKEKVEA